MSAQTSNDVIAAFNERPARASITITDRYLHLKHKALVCANGTEGILVHQNSVLELSRKLLARVSVPISESD